MSSLKIYRARAVNSPRAAAEFFIRRSASATRKISASRPPKSTRQKITNSVPVPNIRPLKVVRGSAVYITPEIFRRSEIPFRIFSMKNLEGVLSKRAATVSSREFSTLRRIFITQDTFISSRKEKKDVLSRRSARRDLSSAVERGNL